MKNKFKIACVFNYAPHYRESIFNLIANSFNCDFYVGENLNITLKSMDLSKLEATKFVLHNKYLYKNFFWQKGCIKSLSRKYKYIIIDGEPYNLSNWVILVLGLLLNIKVCVWTHGWYGRESFLKRKLKKMFFGFSYHIFSYSEYAINLMLVEGFDKTKMSCIYNSLNYDLQKGLRQTLGFSRMSIFANTNPIIIFSGRLNRAKHLDLLFEALHLLNYCKINVIIIGDGEEKRNLEDVAQKMQIPNVLFVGSCYDEIVLANYYSMADLCVCPGSIGLSVIHSLSFGTPIITHDNYAIQGPEFEAIKKGITGDFYKYGDVRDLSRKIDLWLSRLVDRQEVRQKCFKIIDDKYNPYNQLQILKNIIK